MAAAAVAADGVHQKEGMTRAAAIGLASEATAAEAIRELHQGPSPPIDVPVSAANNGSVDAAALAAANAAVSVADDSSGDATALAAANAAVSAALQRAATALAEARDPAARSTAAPRQQQLQQHGSLGLEAEPTAEAGSSEAAVREAVAGMVPSFLVTSPAASATPMLKHLSQGGSDATNLVLVQDQQLQQSQSHPAFPAPSPPQSSPQPQLSCTAPSQPLAAFPAPSPPQSLPQPQRSCAAPSQPHAAFPAPSPPQSSPQPQRSCTAPSQPHAAFPAPSPTQSSPQPQDEPQGQLQTQSPSKGPPLAVPQLCNPSQPQPQPQPHTYYQSYQQHKTHQQQQQRHLQQPKEMPPWLRANEQQRHPTPRRPPSPARGRAAQLPSGPARRSVSSGPAMMAAGRGSSFSAGGGSRAEPPVMFPGGRSVALGGGAAASPFLSPGRLRAPPLAQSPSVRPAAAVDASWSGRNSLGGGPARFTSPGRHSSAESAHFLSPSRHGNSSSWQQQAGARSSAAAERPASAEVHHSLGGGSACFMSPSSMHSSVWQQQQQQLGTRSESAAEGGVGGPAAAGGGVPPTVSSSEPALWVTEQSPPVPEATVTMGSCSLEVRLDDDEAGSSRIGAAEAVAVMIPCSKPHHGGGEVGSGGGSGIVAPQASCSDPRSGDCAAAGSVNDATAAAAAMTPPAPRQKPCFTPQQHQHQLRSPQLNLLRSVGSKQLLQVREMGWRGAGQVVGSLPRGFSCVVAFLAPVVLQLHPRSYFSYMRQLHMGSKQLRSCPVKLPLITATQLHLPHG